MAVVMPTAVFTAGFKADIMIQAAGAALVVMSMAVVVRMVMVMFTPAVLMRMSVGEAIFCDLLRICLFAAAGAFMFTPFVCRICSSPIEMMASTWSSSSA